MIASWSSERAGVRLERRRVAARDGLVGLEQTFRGNGTRVAVTHHASVVAQVTIRRGALAIGGPGSEIAAPAAFVLVVPPRSVVRMCFHDAVVTSVGVAGKVPLVGPPSLRSFFAFPLDGPGTASAAAGDVLVALDPDADPPHFVVAARAALHRHLGHPAPVRRAARAVNVAPETLARAFQRAYGLGAKEDCHRARLFDAVIALLGGAAIAQSAFDAGFNDLKRFYTQFRRTVGATPGDYAIKKRQDRHLPSPP